MLTNEFIQKYIQYCFELNVSYLTQESFVVTCEGQVHSFKTIVINTNLLMKYVRMFNSYIYSSKQNANTMTFSFHIPFKDIQRQG